MPVSRMIWVANAERSHVATAGELGVMVAATVTDGPASVKGRKAIITLDAATVAEITRLWADKDAK
jgi:hypothetical protein